ncbi:hypothetical protein E5D57_010774 [Metarhizium anisopliae]|nr:hypothetical protein E5D57_010774 [Metarhizium anisopliae]
MREISRIIELSRLMPRRHLIKVLPAYFEGGSLPEYKVNSKTMCGITLGHSKATGQMGNMKVFSWLIWWFKGRFLGTDKGPGINAAGKTTMPATFEKSGSILHAGHGWW